MNSNKFIERDGRMLYQCADGYALQYTLTKEFGLEFIGFAGQLVKTEELENNEQILPIDRVCRCIFDLIQERKDIMVTLYGRLMEFKKNETLYSIKRRIRKIQMSLIHVAVCAPDVTRHFQNKCFVMIKEMPTH